MKHKAQIDELVELIDNIDSLIDHMNSVTENLLETPDFALLDILQVAIRSNDTLHSTSPYTEIRVFLNKIFADSLI